MSGKIPKYFISEILFRTNIVDLINTKINLKKTGKNYQTNCPFHNDKTPSFTVSYEKQFYYCFGCNAHGNAIDFLIHYENLSFIESVEELSTLHGLKIPFKKNNKIERDNYLKKNKLYFLLEKLSKLYIKNILLTNTAYQYLKKRGISEKMIKLFSIGFANTKWSLFSKQVNITKEFEKELLDFKIISINKYGNIYDPFQGRIIFPIYDQHNRIVGFGGRTIHNILPKYINSPENDIFHKGKQIYGLNQIKKIYDHPEYLLVVEGYIDVVMLTQHNINYVVSSLGTSTTKDHIKILFRNTNTIIYCYDGDNAGKDAAWRTLKIALPYISDKKNIKFVILPDNEDPDTIIKKEGREKFQIRINNALTMSKFFFKNILKNVDLSSNDDKFHLSVHALPLINRIPSDTIRIYLRQMLARIIGILDDNQFEKFLHEKERKNKNIIFQIKHTNMRILIALLIQNPNLALLVISTKKFENSKINGLSIFLKILKTCSDNPKINTGQLIEFYRDTKIINIIRILSKWDHMIIQEKIKNVFLDLLKNIYNQILEKKYNDLISKERIKGLTNNEKKEIWCINKKLIKK